MPVEVMVYQIESWDESARRWERSMFKFSREQIAGFRGRHRILEETGELQTFPTESEAMQSHHRILTNPPGGAHSGWLGE